MKQLFKHVLCSMLLIMHSNINCQNNFCPGISKKRHVKLPKEEIKAPCGGPRTLFLPRSQGSNLARRMAGWHEIIPGCDDRVFGNFSVAASYNRSLKSKSKNIAQYLFGSNCLHFVGSQVPNRNPERDLIADYFGLPTTFIGKACFKPVIENWVVDFNFSIGLDSWVYGLYFKANAPLVVTRWDIGLHCNEKNNIPADTIPLFPPCYMSSPCNSEINPNCDALNETPKTAESIRQALSGCFLFGDMKDPISFGKFSCGKISMSGLANFDVIFGWNFILNECGHFGPYVMASAPTGNKPNSEFIFEPIIGNGDLWELGGGFSGHIVLAAWQCESLEIYFDAYLTKQLRQYQVRSFDFCNRGPLSRYMLLKEFDSNKQYNGRLANGIDFTTHLARIGGSLKGEACIKLVYYSSRWGAEIGYNVYGKTNEKIKLLEDLFPSDLNTKDLGFKGTEGVCSRVFDTQAGEFTGDMPRLNSTQTRATITHSGPVDNPAPIALPAGEIALTWDNKIALRSNPPVIIDERFILDLHSGTIPKQLTHKVWAHISYTFFDKCWEPQLGFGGEYEVDGKKRNLSSLNQWGVWFKAGISF